MAKAIPWGPCSFGFMWTQGFNCVSQPLSGVCVFYYALKVTRKRNILIKNEIEIGDVWFQIQLR